MKGTKKINVAFKRGGKVLQDHMKRILEQCRLQDDYAKDLDERGWFQRGWRGSTPTLEYHIAIRCVNNTGPYPLENHKATKPSFIDGPSLARQKTAI